MKKSILSFGEYLLKEDGSLGITGAPATTDSSGDKRPETEREAKSRIAADLVKSLFGGVQGLTGSIDSAIEITPEVKESRPYKGCGASEPFKLERTPIPLKTFKILLKYLQDKNAGDYSRAIKELDDKRAVIIGVRNHLNVKKDAANQDRFTDALYFIPGNADDGETTGATGSLAINTGATGTTGAKESKVLSFNVFSQIYEQGKDPFNNTKDLSLPRFSISETDNATGAATGMATGSAPVNSFLGAGSTATNINLGDKFIPYQITTVPSLAFYGKKPLNPKGTGIKMPGDTVYYLKESTLGHGRYKMMVEGEKIKVGRYPIGVTKYETYKPADVYTEDCGMQIHRSSTKGVGVCVGPWSGGCQVFSDYDEFKDFISKAEREQMNAGKFIYALIQLDDIEEKVLQDAMNGISQEDASSLAIGATGGGQEPDETADGVQDTDVEDVDSQKLEKIASLSKFIKDEKEKYDSDEEAVIKKYNSIIKSDEDWKNLEKKYGSNLWSDLDSFLDSDEKEQLKFRNTKALE
jgi:hypothetical protein